MTIPSYVLKIIKDLEKAGYEAYAVGGCVRDFLLSSYAKASEDKIQNPKDWDITTNARPKEIMKIFPDSKYENIFGTVLVKIKNKAGETENVVEITTYRSEARYSDRRHPDEIKFEEKLEKDLERRDFTINAMALRPAMKKQGRKIPPTPFIPPTLKLRRTSKGAFEEDVEIIDLFGGRKDVQKKIIRAVGEPSDRFKEDALRMMRAIRFSSQLGFAIEPKTERAISKLAGSIRFVSNERIADELIKILSSPRPYEGMMAMHETKLLQYVLPELTLGVKVAQDRHHIHDVFTHSMLSLKHCPSLDWRVRFAALLHDVGKVKTRKIINGIATFYNHEMVSAKLADKIMKRLHFSGKDMEKINTLVRYHMFYYNTDEVTASSVRRLISRVGKENLKDLIELRIADRLGSGTPKAKPYKLRHLEYMMEKVQNDPVSVKMLKINGDYMLAKLGFQPGPAMGAMLDIMLAEVIEDPKLNTLAHLKKRALELKKLNPEELRAKAKEVIKEKREEDDQKLKGEYWVK